LDVLLRDGVEWKEEISSDRFSGFWHQQLQSAMVGFTQHRSETKQRFCLVTMA
jgi:hypothetical protein